MNFVAKKDSLILKAQKNHNPYATGLHFFLYGTKETVKLKNRNNNTKEILSG